MLIEGFSERLRAARAAAQLTQQFISDELKCTSATIANWEHDRAVPGSDDLARLATLYHVSADWLLTGKRMPHRFESSPCPHGGQISERCLECERAAKVTA